MARAREMNHPFGRLAWLVTIGVGWAGRAVAQPSPVAEQPATPNVAPAPQPAPYPYPYQSPAPQPAPYPYPYQSPAPQPAPYPYPYQSPGMQPATYPYQYPYQYPAPSPYAAAPAPAAQPQPAPPLESRFGFGVLVGLTHLSEDNSSLTVSNPVVQGRVAFRHDILADVDWGFVVARDSDSGFTARTGNPWIKAWYRRGFGGMQVQGGLGITLPLASVTLGADGRLQRSLYNHSQALWGMADVWRWAPDRMAVPVVVETEYPVSMQHILSAQLALAPVTGVRNSESGTDLCGQLAVAGRLMLVPTFWMGARLQGVLLPSASVDRLQTAVALRVEWTPRAGRFFLEGLVNLDEPVGVFGRGTRAWGLFLGKELAR